jgi:uncharacterized repeat protein (TIGR03847 family)
MSTADLGLVEVLGAEAVGQPGQRRFRLFAQSGRGSIVMWMEKEQLNALSLGIDQLLEQLTQGQFLRTEAQAGPSPSVPGMPANFPRRPMHEFQVAEMRLGYDERRNLLQLVAAPLEIILEPGQEPQAIVREEEAVTLLFTLGQAQQLSTTITVVVTSGRPVCPLCHTPLVEGVPHACVKQNGHREIVQMLEEDSAEDEEG